MLHACFRGAAFELHWKLLPQVRFRVRGSSLAGKVPTEMPERAGWLKPTAITIATTLIVALLSRLPDSVSATAVGFGFLAASYWLVLRRDDSAFIARHGLSLGGLFDPEPLSPARIARDTWSALTWALATALITLPPFWLGFLWWWRIRAPFQLPRLSSLGSDFSGQLLVIALPEEAFYRGYLQSTLDEVWKPRFRVLGAELGPGLIVTSALFALGHLSTEFNAARLAVFFPSLVFGYLRARTGGIGAGVVFHALCNLFASYLAQSYGFER